MTAQKVLKEGAESKHCNPHTLGIALVLNVCVVT